MAVLQLDIKPDPIADVLQQPQEPQGPPIDISKFIQPGGNVLELDIERPQQKVPTILETFDEGFGGQLKAVGRGLQGQAQVGLALGTGIATDIVGGVAGTVQALNPFAEEGAGLEALNFVKQFAFKPGPLGQEIAKGIGEIAETLTPDVILQMTKAFSDDLKTVQEEIFQDYGAAAATAFAIAGPAVLEGTAGYATIKHLRRMETTRADEAIQETEDVLRELGVDTHRIDIQPEDKTLRQIGKDLIDEDAKAVIDAIQPNAERLEAAQRLGVVTNPSAYSDNLAYIALEQGLKSKPDNKLRQIEEEAITKLGEKADELITDQGGFTDKGLLDEAVKKRFKTIIEDLEQTSNKAYEKVNAKVKMNRPVTPATSRLYIEKRLDDLGGKVSLLQKSERVLAEILGLPRKKKKTPEGEVEIGDEELPQPTFGALDQVRRQVGEGIEKKSGPYKDDETSILNGTYASISNDQQAVADAFNVGSTYERAQKLVKMRKGVEKKSVELFGKDLDTKSLIPKLLGAATKLSKGDITDFKKLVAALPPSQRQTAVATLLNNLFTFGSSIGGKLGGGFPRVFEALNRNPTMKKAIFDELPPAALQTFNDLGNVATGLFRSKALQNNSGTANAILANMDNGSWANKILKSRRLASPFSKFGRALSFTAAFLTRVLPKRTKVGADFLTSPGFTKSLENAALGKKVSAENVTKTREFNDWFVLLDDETRKRISTIGFIAWYLEDGESIEIDVNTEELRRRQQGQ